MKKTLANLFSTRPNGRVAAPVAPKAETSAQAELLSAIEACYLKAENYFSRSFPRPEINFKLRGKSAGTAHLALNKLRFNPILLEENQQAFVDEVVPHEICHLLCHQLFGKVRPHGKEWQSLMQGVYGLSASTTHSFDTQSVAGKYFDYQCHCGLVKLSLRRHNKVLRGQSEYQCRRCQQRLKPAGRAEQDK